MKYNKYTIIAIIAITALAIMPVASFAVSNGEDDVQETPAPADNSGGAGGDVSNGGDDVSGTGTGDTGTGSGADGRVQNGGDDDTGTGNGGNPGGNDNGELPNGSAPTGSRLGTQSSGSSISTLSGTVKPILVNVVLEDNCPLLTKFLKKDWSNGAGEVSKLQAFLKNSEKLDVEVNGIFDEKTEAGVMAFQKKYLDSVLGPWNATLPSGMVYITTQKKINELACAQPLTLNSEELAIIEAWKEKMKDSGSILENSNPVEPVTAGLVLDLDQDEDNVAAVGDTSFFGKSWNFITGLFR